MGAGQWGCVSRLLLIFFCASFPENSSIQHGGILLMLNHLFKRCAPSWDRSGTFLAVNEPRKGLGSPGARCHCLTACNPTGPTPRHSFPPPSPPPLPAPSHWGQVPPVAGTEVPREQEDVEGCTSCKQGAAHGTPWALLLFPACGYGSEPRFWRKTFTKYFIPHEELKLNIRP